MDTENKSAGHICFFQGFEYFWATDHSGSRFVAKAAISNPMDSSTAQRIGARFEGTEAWFYDFGSQLMTISDFSAQ